MEAHFLYLQKIEAMHLDMQQSNSSAGLHSDAVSQDNHGVPQEDDFEQSG